MSTEVDKHRNSLQHHKKNTYSPLFSPISTYRYYPDNRPFRTQLESRRSASSSGVYKRRTNTTRFNYLNDRRVLSMEEAIKDTPERTNHGSFLEGLKDSLWNSGRYLWHTFMKNEPHNDDRTELDTKGNANSESSRSSSRSSSNSTRYGLREESPLNIRKHKFDTSIWVLPSKKRRIESEDKSVPSNSSGRSSAYQEGSSDRYNTVTFSKDPFGWNKWKTSAISSSPDTNIFDQNSHSRPQYGTAFIRRNKFVKQNINDTKLVSRAQSEEVTYLRQIFNGEYTVPKILKDERARQLKLMDMDKAKDAGLKNSIIDLTEKIKAILIENNNKNKLQAKDKDDDDLVFVKEKKVSSLEKKHKDYLNQKIKFDKSILKFEKDFKKYNEIINERKKIQEDLKKKKEQLVKKELVPQLSEKDDIQIEKVLVSRENAQLMNRDNLEISVRDFKTLAPKRWLNDTIIEFFMKYIEKSNADTVAFNSFFYTNLSERGYQGVRRWMKRKKTQIDKLDKIFTPINLNQSHWALGIIDLKKKTIGYVDSLSNGPNAMSFAILTDLQKYVIQESKHSMGEDFDLIHLDCPQQPNGYDCGIYVCMNTLYGSADAPLDFNYNDAIRMRRFIAHLILTDALK
ncbi:SUMO protease ULP1 [Saccharomyces eubayanus]|uniref:SUMO protease ULP1 n=1 Tax=Saccharomyces eubayanus TaxID=1080349 RepID=UPI0006C4F172|nr:ULP1-like protein [Saccharomyces eubayanus]KOG96286.1 ULP1-like protein [Saccharomyces eubayanus]